MSIFLCWDILNASEDNAREIESSTPENAAVKYAHKTWEQGDPLMEMDISVRDKEDGTLVLINVQAIQEYNFYPKRISS